MLFETDDLKNLRKIYDPLIFPAHPFWPMPCWYRGNIYPNCNMLDSEKLVIDIYDIRVLDIKIEKDFWPGAKSFLKRWLDDKRLKVLHAELIGGNDAARDIEEQFFGLISLYDTSNKFLDVIYTGSHFSSVNLELISKRWREVDVVYRD